MIQYELYESCKFKGGGEPSCVKKTSRRLIRRKTDKVKEYLQKRRKRVHSGKRASMKNGVSHTARHINWKVHLHHPHIYQELTNKWQRWVDIPRLVQEVVFKPRSSQLIAALQNNFWASSKTCHPSEEAVRIGQLQMVEAWVPMAHGRNNSTVSSRMKGRVGYLKMYSATFNCFYAEV